ncbi:nodal homolog 2-A-like [Rana temporaria]|uniref:nodal homolog 2-A-like n=1 Tax=Rana temporaria TaxID=8407 RepID=UPI001AAC7BB7|nr:nodal homolog 2-A-like [Rana temporaria]
MTWLNVILYLTTISMVKGLPAFMQGNQKRIPLQQSNHGLGTSSSLDGQAYSSNTKYSPFMMQLYQSLIMGTQDTGLSSLEHSLLQDSDTVLRLTAKRCTKMDNHRSLYFDMSSLSGSNEIRLAEFRIQLSPTEKTQDMTLHIYHSEQGSKRLLLQSFHIDSSVTMGSSWKVFNLTKILNAYLNLRQSSNYDDIMGGGTSSQKDHENACTDISTDRVVLMVFTKDNPSANVNGYLNLIQTVESSKYVMTPEVKSEQGIKRHRKNRNIKDSIIMNHFPSRTVENGKPLCERVDMMVDFEKFGWGNLIIYPKNFNAYRCEGACPIPLSETFKPTNHAYIMSLLKLFNSDNVECASCVPVKMRPLSMLMYENGDIVMKHNEDMIVEECGCH